MNWWVVRYSCHRGWIYFLMQFFIHLILMYVLFSPFLFVCFRRDRYIFSSSPAHAFKTMLRDSTSCLLGMLCSEFIWWSCESGWGIAQSGLEFLSLCGYQGLWGPDKTPPLVCMWQGLICYSLCGGGKFSSGFVFFPVCTPWELCAPKPKPFLEQTKFHVIPNQNVG